MKQRYWNFMTQKKYALIYLSKHLANSIAIERFINVTLAIASTGSLAGLLFLPKAQLILSIVLAIAQILTAAHPYLPYEKRITDLEKGIAALNIIYVQIEENWESIFYNEADESKINELYYKFDKLWNETDSQILQFDMLPKNQKFMDEAEIEKNKYFEIMFGGENGTEGNTRE